MVRDEHTDTLRRLGLNLLDMDQVLAELPALITCDSAAVVVADGDWQRFGGLYGARRATTLFDDLLAERIDGGVVDLDAAAEEAKREENQPSLAVKTGD